MTHLPLALVFTGALSLGAGAARANGYGEARQLIDQAEAAFAAGDEARALELLGQALKTQTVPDAKGKEYGYASTIHFRLAKHFDAKGEPARAKAELRRAFAVKGQQGWVEPAYRISRADPLVAKLLPELTRLPTRPLDKGRLVPRATAMRERGGQVFVLGDEAIYRLDRRARALQTFDAQSGSHAYRLDVAPGGDAVLFAYENPAELFVAYADGRPLTSVPRPFLPDGLYFAADGKAAVIYPTMSPTAYRVELDGGGKRLLFELAKESGGAAGEPRAEALLGRQGKVRVLQRSGTHVVYGQLGDLRLTDTVEGRLRYAAHFFADGATLPLVELPFRHGEEEQTVIASAADRQAIAFYLRPAAGRPPRLTHCDLERRACATFGVKLGSDAVASIAPELTYTPARDQLIALWASPAGLELQRVRLTDGEITFARRYAFAAALGREISLQLFGTGTLGDSFWAQLGDHIFIADAEGGLVAANAARFVRAGPVEWDGMPYAFRDPDELYVNVAKGGGRFFFRIGFDELRAKGKTIPDQQSAAKAPPPKLGGKSCAELLRLLDWPYASDPAELAHVRAVIDRLFADCNLADGAVELVTHVLRLPWEIGAEQAEHQRFLYQALRKASRSQTLLMLQLQYLDRYQDPALALANLARYLHWDGQRGPSDHPMTACHIGGGLIEGLIAHHYQGEQRRIVEAAAGPWAAQCLALEHGQHAYLCALVLEAPFAAEPDFFRSPFGAALACGLRARCRAALAPVCAEQPNATACQAAAALQALPPCAPGERR